MDPSRRKLFAGFEAPVGRLASLTTGAHQGYLWLASTEHYMCDFVRLCPEALLNRYLVVVRVDAGEPGLTEGQQAAGWRKVSGLLRSPRLSSAKELSYQRDGFDAPGYDEWYLFEADDTEMGEVIEGNPFLEENAPGPGRLMEFVSSVGFTLAGSSPSWEFHRRTFWDQLNRLHPVSFVCDGSECLTFVTREADLFERVREGMRSSGC